MQLGHGGFSCDSPGRRILMTILHTNAFHHVNIQFCACSTNVELRLERNQLLAVKLFPASFESPKTAFTFDLLKLITTLSARGKVSAYDYYQVLRCLTDSCELLGWPVSRSYRSTW
jgi:hypothetical protein